MATSIAKLSAPAQTPKTPASKAATTPPLATIGPATRVTVGKTAQDSVPGLYSKTGLVTASPAQKPTQVVNPPAPARVTDSKVAAKVAAPAKPATPSTQPPAPVVPAKTAVAPAKTPVVPAAAPVATKAPVTPAKAPVAPAKAPVAPAAAPVVPAKAPVVPAKTTAPEQTGTKVAATLATAAKSPAETASPAKSSKTVAEPASQETVAKSTPSKDKENVPQPVIIAGGTASSSVAQNNSATFVADGHDVVVDVNASESWFDNRIYWSTDNFATRNYIATDNQTGSVNLGRFATGTVVQFGIDNGQGNFFRTGDGSNNADSLVHAQVSSTGQGTVIGFEDTFQGGDKDFNDAVITVRNVASASAPTPSPAPLPAPAPAPSPPQEGSPPSSGTGGGGDKTKPPAVTPPASDKAPANDQNRSGLGDGTNPGQGAGRDNSPNGGTENPHKV